MDNNTWTTEYPSQPGFYWIRNYRERRLAAYRVSPGPDVVEVKSLVTGELVVFWTGSDAEWSQSDFELAEWCGPIQPPT